jgi:ABC-type nickel/cobalt efflux system permease component RcnA
MRRHKGKSMNRFSIPAIIKFAIGILLVQGATALLVITALRANLRETWLVMLCLALLIGLLAALWFSSIASHCNQQTLNRASEKFSRERDRIRRQSEKEKTKEIKDSHRQLLRETRRVQNRSNVKLGAALAGLATVGVALFFTQFMTLGVLALSLTGGALVGYGVRARQNLSPGKRKAINGGTVEKIPDAEKAELLLPAAKETQDKGPW